MTNITCLHEAIDHITLLAEKLDPMAQCDSIQTGLGCSLMIIDCDSILRAQSIHTAILEAKLSTGIGPLNPVLDKWFVYVRV